MTTSSRPDRITPPSLKKALGELQIVSLLGKAILSRKPVRRRSKGEPVVVVPGLGTGDAATALLRAHLEEAGFDVHTWDQGINRGPRAGVMRKLSQQVRTIARRKGRPVKLVGWSLGGLMARVIAGRLPHDVKAVIALGSPLTADVRASHLASFYAWLNGKPADRREVSRLLHDGAKAPVTSIFSREDGVVAWEASAAAQGRTRNIEVDSTHLGLMVDSDVHEEVSKALSKTTE